MPDVVVLPADMLAERSALTAIAELRSRMATRHSAILMAHEPEDRLSATSALDLGANDLIETDSSAKELRLRLENQLKQRSKNEKLRSTLKKGLHLAVTDPLTGLFNRRYALPYLARLANRSLEQHQPFAVMVLDIDRFKRINDGFGHGAGDQVIATVADRIKNNLRSIDLVVRIGGEEFLVVMPETDVNAGQIAAERLRRVIAATPVMIETTGQEIPVTISIGISVGGLQGQQLVAVDKLVDRADQALMAAKSRGRNLVETALFAA